MERSLTFKIDGLENITITVTEEADGSLRFDIVDTTGATLDLRAIYFDLVGYEHLSGGLSIDGADVGAFAFDDADVTSIGGGTTISGEVVNELGAFDAGVAIEPSGDASSVSFTLSHETEALDLDMLSLADFGVRIEGGTPKSGDTSSMALLATDDAFEVDENALTDTGNVLALDRQSAGLAVTEIEVGGIAVAPGAWTSVTTDSGREGQLRIDADGRFHFDATTGFDDLNVGHTDTLSLLYGSTDANGSRDFAEVSVTIHGLNDGPEVAGPLIAATDEDSAPVTIDLLQGASDVDIGAVLSVAGLTETSGAGGWTSDGNAISIDPAHFTSLAQGQSQVLSFDYLVRDEWGAEVAQSLSVTIEGRNDVPTVASALARRVSEEDPVFAVDLLEGASDVDAGAVLSALNLVETGGQGGWTLDGDSIVIDPDYFDDLNDGDLGVLEFVYDVTDEFGGTARQSLTVEVEGYTDAPFISVEVRAAAPGAGANVVELLVTTEQARDETVALRFAGLPVGAILTDVDGNDASGGVADALGITTYRLELPLGADVSDLTLTVVGLEADGTEIGTRDAVARIGYEATTAVNPLSFFANDVDLWGNSEAFQYSVSEYIPLLGGGREFFELVGATSQTGQVFLDGDEIKWIPDGTYDGLAPGEVATEIVTFTYRPLIEDADGNLVPEPGAADLQAQFEVTVTGGNFFTEFSGEYVKMRGEAVILDPLRTVDVLHDPLSTGILELINIDLDSDDIFASIIDPLTDARDGFAFQLGIEEGKLVQARADADAVGEKFALLTLLTGQRAEVVARQIVYETAKLAADAVETATEFLQDALQSAEDALTSAQSALSSAKTTVSKAKAAYDASVVTIWGVKVGSPTKWAAYKAAQLAQTAAQEVVNLAKKAVDLAQDALDSALADLSADFLAQQETNALAALNEAKADVLATETALEQGGYYTDASALDTGDLALELTETTAALALAEGEVLYYEGTTFGLGVLEDAAQAALDFANGVIATTDFRAQLYASVEAYAQAGFQFDFAISGGTIDAQVDYDMTTISGYNAATDVLSIEVTLENLTTGEDVAFSTVSPNVQVYAGLLYDMGANFEFMVDFFAAIANVVLADLSPDSDGIGITPMPNIEGSVDFIDFDSRDGAGIQFGISGGSDLNPEFLTFNINVPTIETLGRETDPSLDYYTEGDLFALDFGELLGSFRNLIEARIDLSPEVKALLNQAGVDPADPAGGEFLEAFVQALGVVLASATGAGDTDGDGAVPLFLLDATDDTSGALLHINAYPDDLSGLDPATLGQFGFYTAYGESDAFLKVTLDVDQLIATLVNRAAANPTPIVVNPFDLEFGLEDAFALSNVNPETAAKLANWFDLNLNAEFADLDVAAEFNFNQQFTMALNEFDFVFTMEDGTEFVREASDPMLTLTEASRFDANGDGVIDYSMGITPQAEFFNDTEVGMGFTYMLDLIKTSLSAGINLPLEEIFGTDVSLLGLGADNIEFDLFESAVGPLFRVQGDIDVATLDVFENRFDIDLGTTSVDLAAAGVEIVDPAAADVIEIA